MRERGRQTTALQESKGTALQDSKGSPGLGSSGHWPLSPRSGAPACVGQTHAGPAWVLSEAGSQGHTPPRRACSWLDSAGALQTPQVTQPPPRQPRAQAPAMCTAQSAEGLPARLGEAFWRGRAGREGNCFWGTAMASFLPAPPGPPGAPGCGQDRLGPRQPLPSCGQQRHLVSTGPCSLRSHSWPQPRGTTGQAVGRS